MNHPTNEDWMDYLYHELPGARREALAKHLQACPTCHDTVVQWRSAMQSLNAWQLSQTQTPAPIRSSVFKWAVAALLIFSTGLWAGIGLVRIHPPARSIEQSLQSNPSWENEIAGLRAGLTNQLAEIRDQLLDTARRENLQLLARLAAQIQAARREDLEVMQAACLQLEQTMKSDVAWLRHDLETVAIKASDQLYWTRQKLGQLAQVASVAPDLPPNRGTVE